jgi:hypothetical protein
MDKITNKTNKQIKRKNKKNKNYNKTINVRTTKDRRTRTN